MNVNKITVVGCGRVGLTAAYALLLRNIARQLVLYDRDLERMKGEQLEFQHSLAFLGTTTITAATGPADVRDSDVIVFTAGVAQQPGESRLSLAQRNIKILEETLPPLVEQSPQSIVIIVANPVDILTHHATQLLRLPRGRVFGSGTSLDTARFRFHLSELLHISPKNIHAYILGEHGDSSFPVVSSADVGGRPLLAFPGVTPEAVQAAYEKTRAAAGTIIAAKGSTYYAIGVAISQLVSTVLRDSKRIYPVSFSLDGEFGYRDVAISVPCVIGKGGAEKIIEIALSPDEKNQMDASVKLLKQLAGPPSPI
ncbi:L-lactate dehydrogenase [Patescibacteria group bacterium]|nr:L-lactate dehydrogenase [Patescibacteria group bacterium]MCL5091952.1 L-lactate dehydrogenase [Patescibacteria group bacterium]